MAQEQVARMSVGIVGGGVVAEEAGCTGTGDLGYTSEGASAGSSQSGVSKWVAGADICVDVGFAWMVRGEADQVAKMVIMSDNAGTPETVLACSGAVAMPTSKTLMEFTFASPFQIESGTTYWVGYAATRVSTSPSLYYDAGTTPRYSLTITDISGSNCNVSANTSGTARDYSIWVSDN